MCAFSIKTRAILNRAILFLCSILIILLVVVVTWQVFSRYVLNDPSSFTDELSRFSMIWLGLLGTCYLFGKKGHLSITLLNDYLPPKGRKILYFVNNILILAFVFLGMFKGGITLVSRTMMQLSPALQIPMGYVYLILPISAVIIAIYLLLNMWDTAHSTTHLA